MRIVFFYHSLVSDWNHGNAHFLRGVTRELLARGHEIIIYEPRDSWSRANLLEEAGEAALRAFAAHYPELFSHYYEFASLDLDAALDGADLVLVHEWNEPALIAAIGHHHAAHHYVLLFHDTHHRSVSDAAGLTACDLDGFDVVLAFGEAVRQRYLAAGWSKRSWVWHEAADVSVFKPRLDIKPEADLVWIGNWGDDERSEALDEFLMAPAAALGLTGSVYAERYPQYALDKLNGAGLAYRGWLANFDAPAVFARHRVTVHVPRRPYVQTLPGIPTIRVFEALACGIPLVCAPWDDAEGLFSPGADYLVARDGLAMRACLRSLCNEPDTARALAGYGRQTILARHTCAHRVDELLDLYARLFGGPTRMETATNIDDGSR